MTENTQDAPDTQDTQSWRAVLSGAHRTILAVAERVAGPDWDLPTPCAGWTATQVLQHAAGDQVGYAAAITGGPWPSEDPFSPSGKVDGDPQAILAPALAASAAAFTSVRDDDPEVSTPLPLGPLPAATAAGACALDAAVHAWDIAVATGQPSPLTPELARPLLAVATRIVEPLRAFAFGPALDRAAGEEHVDADVATLLRYLGRRPTWSPPPA